MICSLVKKTLVGSALGVAALTLVFGTSGLSYIKTVASGARDAVRSSVPIEFEVARLRNELNNISSKMAGQIQDVVRQEKDVVTLKTDIKQTASNIEGQKGKIVTLRKTLESTDSTKLTGNPTYNANDVKRALETMYDSFKRNETVLAQKEKTLVLREEAVATAHEQLATLQSKKEELLSRLDAIEAQIKNSKVAEVNQNSFDNSVMLGYETKIKELEERMQMKNREAELVAKYLQDNAAEAPAPSRDVVSEIDREFGPVKPANDKNL